MASTSDPSVDFEVTVESRQDPRERLQLRKPDKTLDRFWDMPLRDLLDLLQATPAGLTSAEAEQRLRLHGPNTLVGESRFAALIGFLRFFANPLVLILLAASTISIVLGAPIRSAAPSSSP
jgi:magnesium-transporting ATPase (P-type)